MTADRPSLLFVRHGQTDWNAERRMQGQWESDLSPLGEAQAAGSAALVRDWRADRLFASPLRRTRRTAAAVAAETGIEPVFDERLMERSSGDWSGYLYDEIKQRWPDEFAAWRDDMWHYRPPGAENFVDLEVRGGAFLRERVLGQGGRTAIVSHGFIGRAMIAVLMGLEPQAALGIRQGNDVAFELTPTPDGWRAARFVRGEGPSDGFEEGEAATVA